jgi:hypothetical protein
MAKITFDIPHTKIQLVVDAFADTQVAYVIITGVTLKRNETG